MNSSLLVLDPQHRRLKAHDLVWTEEPLDACDAEGHDELARQLDTPIATGEMLTSVAEHWRLLEAVAVAILQPDAPRVAGSRRTSGSLPRLTTPACRSRRTWRWSCTCT